jgi:NAD+ synthase
MYKSDEYEFGKFLGVPESILGKRPSADLWEGQSDEDELGYSYKQMDDVLKKLVDEGVSADELKSNGVDKELIDMINYRMKANAFKGKLPTIAKIKWS